MVPIRRNRDDAGHQSRFARTRSRAQFRRIRERADGQRLGRPAQGAWPRRAVRRQALVPRQRDGRARGRSATRRRDEYGRLANEVAKTLRAFDRSLELIVCGSSNSDMKTYPEWERIVLEHTYDAVDHISLHMYFANRSEEHRRISRAQRQARRLYQHHRLDDRVRPRQQAQPQAGDDLLRRMERLVSFQRAGSRDPRRRQGLAACAAAARGHLQFRGRAPGRLHPQHLHPPLRRGEDRLHRATGERHRPDHDRARRRGVAADDLLSLFLRLGLRARRSAPAQRQVAGLRFSRSPTTFPISTFPAFTTRRAAR